MVIAPFLLIHLHFIVVCFVVPRREDVGGAPVLNHDLVPIPLGRIPVLAPLIPIIHSSETLGPVPVVAAPAVSTPDHDLPSTAETKQLLL